MFSRRRRSYNRFRALCLSLSLRRQFRPLRLVNRHRPNGKCRIRAVRSVNKSQRRVSCAHCNHLRSTGMGQSVYAKRYMIAWPSSRVISSRFFLRSELHDPSVTLLVRTSLPTFDPIPKPYIVCLSLRARNERSDASNAFPKLLILTIFFVAIPNLHASFSFAYATRTITLEHGDHVWM